MRFANASTFWRRQGREISSRSSSRRLPLDFQCPVSLSSLSEELFEEELFFLLRLRFLPSESELEGLSLGVIRLPSLSRIPLVPDEEFALGERLCPSLSWTLRLPNLEWMLARLSLSSVSPEYCELDTVPSLARMSVRLPLFSRSRWRDGDLSLSRRLDLLSASSCRSFVNVP